MSEHVLVVNDMPGVAKVAGMSNLPLLAAAQFEVALLPTLILSTHTKGYPGLVTHGLDDSFDKILDHWKDMDTHFCGTLTGFFGSSKQITSIINYLESIDYEMPVVVDPIMGDYGELYPSFDKDFPEKFGKLVKYADIIMPNLTEACLITGYPYSEDLGPEDYPKIAQKLCDMGAKHVVLTGVYQDEAKKEDETGYYIYSEGTEPHYHTHEKEDVWFKGVGDISVSLIMAYYLLGDSVKDAVIKSSYYIRESIQHSLHVKRDKKLGIYYEPIIPKFAQEIEQMRKEKGLSSLENNNLG